MKSNRTLILNALLIVILFMSCKKEENNPTPTPPPPPTIAIGESYQGGKIAYILQVGDIGYDANVTHGLIAVAGNQNKIWGCQEFTISVADGTAIGTGAQNTIDIMNGCSTAGIAARFCGDLVHSGYSDWYLPSKNELNKLYINRVAIGGFNNTNNSGYWSSTEYENSDVAWTQRFGDGMQYGSTKNGTNNYVCFVRSF